MGITPKNPDLVYAAIQSCKVLYNTYEMPLTVFADNTLESICVFGTEIQSGYGMQNLGISWNAFKWSSSTEDVMTEDQKVECTIKLTKDDPAQATKNCGETTTPAPPTEPPTTQISYYQHPVCEQLDIASTAIFTHESGCAEGWEEREINGEKKCFMFGGGGSAENGMAKCCQIGGFMPGPKNKSEMDQYYAIYSSIVNTGNNDFVVNGVVDGQLVNGQWRNSLGEILNFGSNNLQWATNEPTGGNKCLRFDVTTQKMMTQNCAHTYGIVCQTEFF